MKKLFFLLAVFGFLGISAPARAQQVKTKCPNGQYPIMQTVDTSDGRFVQPLCIDVDGTLTLNKLSSSTAVTFTSLNATSVTSNATNPALTGFLRLSATDSTCWRNAANTADLCLSKNLSDGLNLTGFASLSVPNSIINASVNTAGHYLRNNGASYVDSGILAADVPVFVASGSTHAVGVVPDPGATAGATRFLREDATWAAPSAGVSTIYSTPSASVAASIGVTTMATSGASGNKYLFNATAIQTTVGVGCTGNTTITLSLTYTDAVVAAAITNTLTGSATGVSGVATAVAISQLNGFVGNFAQWTPVAINAAASTAVQYSVSWTAGAGCTTFPKYYILPVLVQVQ